MTLAGASGSNITSAMQEFAGAADELGVLAAGDLAGKRAGFSNHRLHRARERSPDTELRPNRY